MKSFLDEVHQTVLGELTEIINAPQFRIKGQLVQRTDGTPAYLVSVVQSALQGDQEWELLGCINNGAGTPNITDPSFRLNATHRAAIESAMERVLAEQGLPRPLYSAEERRTTPLENATYVSREYLEDFSSKILPFPR